MMLPQDSMYGEFAGDMARGQLEGQLGPKDIPGYVDSDFADDRPDKQISPGFRPSTSQSPKSAQSLESRGGRSPGFSPHTTGSNFLQVPGQERHDSIAEDEEENFNLQPEDEFGYNDDLRETANPDSFILHPGLVNQQVGHTTEPWVSPKERELEEQAAALVAAENGGASPSSQDPPTPKTPLPPTPDAQKGHKRNPRTVITTSVV